MKIDELIENALRSYPKCNCILGPACPANMPIVFAQCLKVALREIKLRSEKKWASEVLAEIERLAGGE